MLRIEHGNLLEILPRDIYRFHSYLVADGECLVWTGPRVGGTDYGKIKVDGRHLRAHRLAWMIAVGSIPDETPCVLHRCDRPACCRVEHLFLGTHADNHRDRAIKRRGRHSSSGLPFGVSVSKSHPGKYRVLITAPVRQVLDFGRWSSLDHATCLAAALRVLRDGEV